MESGDKDQLEGAIKDAEQKGRQVCKLLQQDLIQARIKVAITYQVPIV